MHDTSKGSRPGMYVRKGSATNHFACKGGLNSEKGDEINPAKQERKEEMEWVSEFKWRFIASKLPDQIYNVPFSVS